MNQDTIEGLPMPKKGLELLKNDITSDMVFFIDLDGTLVDTNFANFLAYKKAINTITKSGYDLLFDSKTRLNRENIQEFIPMVSPLGLQRIIDEKEKLFIEFLPQTRLDHKLAKVLSDFSKTNRMVLVTNCREERAKLILEYHKVLELFNRMIFRQDSASLDTRGNKFQNAISMMKINPEYIIAFEDEEKEVLNAIQAGIQMINPNIYE